MSKHTPAPLHVEKHNGLYEIWPKDLGQTHTNVGMARTKEDATLFAAAPELLAACKEALSMYEVQLQLESAHDPTCKLLRAAIAKAEKDLPGHPAEEKGRKQ